MRRRNIDQKKLEDIYSVVHEATDLSGFSQNPKDGAGKLPVPWDEFEAMHVATKKAWNEETKTGPSIAKSTPFQVVVYKTINNRADHSENDLYCVNKLVDGKYQVIDLNTYKERILQLSELLQILETIKI